MLIFALLTIALGYLIAAAVLPRLGLGIGHSNVQQRAAVLPADSAHHSPAAPARSPVQPITSSPTDWFASPTGPTPVIRHVIGNRSQPGPFLDYYRTPAGTSLGAHRHTADMHVKVVEGVQFILMGDLETARVQRFEAGSAFVIPAGVWHVEWFETDTLVEISGLGPMRTERPPNVVRERQINKPAAN